MICSVNQGGDSNSSGAVGGSIIGALLGYEVLPNKFIEPIQQKDVLISVADALS